MLPMTGATAEGAAPGRSADFKSGALGQGPYTLSASSDSFNNKASDAANRTHSVLNMFYHIPSPTNGNSEQDALRQTPRGQLPSKNDGYSPRTYAQLNPNFSQTINTN